MTSPPYPLQHTPTGTPYITLPLPTSTTPLLPPLFLTPYYPTDAAALHATLSLASVSNHLISVPTPYTLADAESWIELQASGKGNLRLQVLREGRPDEAGRAVGSVSLCRLHDGKDGRGGEEEKEGGGRGEGENMMMQFEYELGYFLHPDYQGRGVMKVAVRAELEWARRECGARRVVVRVVEGNGASRATVEGSGEFVRCEEEMVDWVEWPEGKGGGGRMKILFWRMRHGGEESVA